MNPKRFLTKTALTILALAMLSGCKHYRAEVTVNPDGSGTRSLAMTVQSGEDEIFSPASAEFRELFGVTAVAGWKTLPREDGKSEKGPAGFRRDRQVSGASAWRRQSGDILVRGRRTGSGGFLLGYGQGVEVKFTNTVSLDREETAEGVVFTYRESFAWTGLLEVFVEFYTRNLDEDLASGFPDVSAEKRAELRGMLSGMLTAWLMRTDLSEGADVDTEDLERSFLNLAERSLRADHPDLDRNRLRVLLETLFDDTEDELDGYLKEQYPGAHGTVFSDVEIRVTLPGRILETNADEREGATGVWTVDIWDTLARPREILARSTTAP